MKMYSTLKLYSDKPSLLENKTLRIKTGKYKGSYKIKLDSETFQIKLFKFTKNGKRTVNRCSGIIRKLNYIDNTVKVYMYNEWKFIHYPYIDVQFVV